MSAHTPGPWRISAPGFIFYVQGAGGEYILKRDSRNTFDKSAASRIEADCHLIAAAPELLAALQVADRTFAENGLLACHAARKEIRAAIAKATGSAA